MLQYPDNNFAQPIQPPHLNINQLRFQRKHQSPSYFPFVVHSFPFQVQWETPLHPPRTSCAHATTNCVPVRFASPMRLQMLSIPYSFIVKQHLRYMFSVRANIQLNVSRSLLHTCVLLKPHNWQYLDNPHEQFKRLLIRTEDEVMLSFFKGISTSANVKTLTSAIPTTLSIALAWSWTRLTTELSWAKQDSSRNCYGKDTSRSLKACMKACSPPTRMRHCSTPWTQSLVEVKKQKCSC